jgi:hypothetical protein
VADLGSLPRYISISESVGNLFVIFDKLGDVVGMHLLDVFLLT